MKVGTEEFVCERVHIAKIVFVKVCNLLYLINAAIISWIKTVQILDFNLYLQGDVSDIKPDIWNKY